MMMIIIIIIVTFNLAPLKRLPYTISIFDMEYLLMYLVQAFIWSETDCSD